MVDSEINGLRRVFPVFWVVWLVGLFYLTVGFVPPAISSELAISLRSVAWIGVFLVIPGVALYRFLGSRPERQNFLPPRFGSRTMISVVAAWLAAHLLLVFFLPELVDQHGVPIKASSLVRVFLPQFTAALVIWRALSKEETAWLVPRSGRESLFAAGWGVAAACLLIALLSVVVLGAGVAGFGSIADRTLTASMPELRRDLFEIVMMVLLIPFCEEILFRLGLMGWLMKRVSARGAIILSAVIFATLHMQTEIFWARLAGGIFMGWVYLRSGSLVAPWVLHVLMNGGLLLTPLVWNQFGG